MHFLCKEAGMKKIVFILMTLSFLFCSVHAYAVDINLMNIRRKIFNEAEEIKALLSPKSKDTILITSAWNSCLMTAVQLDGYFNMVGIFNTVKQKDWTREALDYLLNWLDQLKKINELNIKNIDASPPKAEAGVKNRLSKIRENFIELGEELDREISSLKKVRQTVKK